MADVNSHVHYIDIVNIIKSKDVNALRTLLETKHIELLDEKNESVLHVAARVGDVDVIRTLLEDWRVARLLDHEMYNHDTPLEVAARNNNVGAVSALADYGAEVWDERLESGNTILHLAASFHNSDLLNTLIARNPPPKIINEINNFGETALDIALMLYSPSVKVLLQAGANCLKPNVFTGRNVLHTCVAYNQCEVLRELISSQNLRHLTNLADRRGDTPLMLAIRTACLDCVQLLIKFVKVGKEVNEVTGESLLHIAVQTDLEDILLHILMFLNEHVINYRDFKGRTPLLLAIEIQKNQCLKTLINTQNVYVKNEITQETALHTAIRVNNETAIDLLMKQNNHVGTWFFSQQNKDGKTPFWVAVENDHGQFVAEARKEQLVDIDQLNQQGDSCTFVAAACGHIKVLKTLLLSEKFYSFCKNYDKETDFKDSSLVREAEISCDIYCSDIFILTDEVRRNRSHSWFPKSLLNINTKNGRNIFHACALGGNASCLDLIFNFVNIFIPSALILFDLPDAFGNTPLLLATRIELSFSGCVNYFLSNHADISSYNNEGDSVLESILRNTESSTDLLMSLLNKGITYDQSAKGLQNESECLHVDFSIFRPPNEPITKVVRLFYEKIHGEQRNILLQHTLFKMYVSLVLNSVNYFFVIRFLLSCFSTLLLTVYLIFYSHTASELYIILYIRYCFGILNVFGLLFSFPLLLHNDVSIVGNLTTILMVLPCLLGLGLVIVPHGSDFSLEIAAITVLIDFFSLMMYSTTVFKEISLQLAMFSQVIYGMFVYMGTVFFVLLAFSLAFYCIFNNSYYFVSPFKSFIFTAYILFNSDTHDCFDFFQNKHLFYNKTNSDGSIKTKYDYFASQLDLYLESTLILIFIIAVNLAMMNMLVSLAVRDDKTLEAGGSIFRRHLQIHWLSNLEMFLGSFIYKLIKNTPIIYLFGIVPSKTFIDVETTYYPMFDKTQFTKNSIIEIKRTFAKNIAQKELSNTHSYTGLSRKFKSTLSQLEKSASHLTLYPINKLDTQISSYSFKPIQTFNSNHSYK